LKKTAFTQPDAYFRRYADLTEKEAIEEAKDIWKRINEVNLRENILPTRARASLILEKASDHSVRRVRMRR
jgi:type I pantothenate kinase